MGQPTKGTTERGGGSQSAYRSVDMAKAVASGVSQAELLQDTENAVAFLQHHKGYQALKDCYIQDANVRALREAFSGSRWYTWQSHLIRELVDNSPNSRTIIWYVDVNGNHGKTYLSRYLITHMDCIRFENGKSTDIKYAFRGQRTVVFDLSRSQEDHVNYEVIESVKNGVVFSPKYESRCAVYPIPHLVVFANFEPDKSKLSADRWDIRYLGPEDCVIPPDPPEIDNSDTVILDNTQDSTQIPCSTETVYDENNDSTSTRVWKAIWLDRPSQRCVL